MCLQVAWSANAKSARKAKESLEHISDMVLISCVLPFRDREFESICVRYLLRFLCFRAALLAIPVTRASLCSNTQMHRHRFELESLFRHFDVNGDGTDFLFFPAVYLPTKAHAQYCPCHFIALPDFVLAMASLVVSCANTALASQLAVLYCDWLLGEITTLEFKDGVLSMQASHLLPCFASVPP